MRKSALVVAAVGVLAAAVPAKAQMDNWAVAVVASSEYGGSINVGDPTGQLPVSPSGGTSQCTSTAEGAIDTVRDADGLVEFALSIVCGLLQEAGLPLPCSDIPDLPDADLPPVDLPDGCTPAVGVNGVEGGNWSAVQATGPADTYPSCGDIATAWAPSSSGTDPESIILLYQSVTNAQRVDVYETNVGGFVTEVIVHLADGSSQTVFTGPDSTACPGILSIPLSGNPTVVAVEIHTQAPGWEEIDAVSVVN